MYFIHFKKMLDTKSIGNYSDLKLGYKPEPSSTFSFIFEALSKQPCAELPGIFQIKTQYRKRN